MKKVIVINRASSGFGRLSADALGECPATLSMQACATRPGRNALLTLKPAIAKFREGEPMCDLAGRLKLEWHRSPRRRRDPKDREPTTVTGRCDHNAGPHGVRSLKPSRAKQLEELTT